MEYRFRLKYLAPGTPTYVWQTLQEYNSLSTCSWTPDTAQDYILYVYAREKGSKTTYDLYKEMPYSVKQPVSQVVFTTSLESPIGVGTPVKLIATPTGGGTLEYKFYATYQDSSSATHVELIQDFATNNIVTWTPKVAATYNPLTVVVREKGKTGEFNFDMAREIFGYEVVPAVSSLKLYTIPENFIPVGFAVDIIAEATGGGNLEYQFKAKYLSGTAYVWQTLQAYGPESLCAWSPTEAHSYIIYAYAREVGTTIPYKVYRELAFTVTP
ncbi:MAG: hypothetical protein WCJ56_14425 [bacterium]